MAKRRHGQALDIGQQKRGRTMFLAAFVAVLTSSCSSVPVATCPAIVPYTPEQQTRVADELETLPPDAMTRRFVTDYGILRAKLRTCQS